MRVAKIIVSSLLAATCVCTTSAQERRSFEQEVAVGVSGGVNMSQVRFLHNNTSYTSMIGDQSLFNQRGMTAGVNALYIAQNHFGVFLECNLTQKGWCEQFRARNGQTERLVGADEVDFNGVDLDRELTYIDIPLLAHIYFGRKARAYVNFGPQVSFLIKEKDETVVSDLQKQTLTLRDPRVNPDIETSKFDLSLCAAVGFDLHLEKVHPMLEIRWNYGTHDLYECGKMELFQRASTQNLALVLKFMLPVSHFYSN